MSHSPRKIVHAQLTSLTEGVVELAKDWKAKHLPPIRLNGRKLTELHRVPDYQFGCESGFFVNRKGEIYFFLDGRSHPKPYARLGKIYLAGDFSGWADAIGKPEWELRPASLDGNPVFLWVGKAERFFAHPPMRFKFVTEEGHWFEVPHGAPNAVRDDGGNLNRAIEPERTGHHLYRFVLPQPWDLTQKGEVTWAEGDHDSAVPLRPGAFFYDLRTQRALGAIVDGELTTFRLFAPRASRVSLCLRAPDSDPRGEDETPLRYDLERCPDSPDEAGVWETSLDQNLHGWFYWYLIDGPADAFGLFDPRQMVLDPYAKAAVHRAGPGIVLDDAQIARPAENFATPAWQDLIIVEAHVRDLAAHAPVQASAAERRGFSGLKAWVESPDFYLDDLGVNCVELQPLQEFDNETSEEYHWGYMTNNFFAPESSYALDPAKASGVSELQELVAAFHRRGMAVILDVVYNHVGVPGHLMFVDKLYYFEVEGDGTLSNWSGCGNDLRARSAMARRLIIDSCIHLVKTYGVDGFRFDLAELVGKEVLQEIEAELKRVKPDVILIAEPWSFRGHIAGALAETGWASWNDGYRNFMRDFVRGSASRDAFEYYLKGSPWYFARWPAQTVNYTESHDDRAWIDNITENADGNGDHPTTNDRRRTHLMAATLFGSIGIPMISAGQDFLRSKQGVNNTYQRGDLNALNYRRLQQFSGSHAYFADWIAFRRSEAGRLLRHYDRASDGFFQFTFTPDSVAAAVVYNADGSQGPERLLLLLNPTEQDTEIPLGAAASQLEWTQLADHERFFSASRLRPPRLLGERVYVPALGSSLWQARRG